MGGVGKSDLRNVDPGPEARCDVPSRAGQPMDKQVQSRPRSKSQMKYQRIGMSSKFPMNELVSQKGQAVKRRKRCKEEEQGMKEKVWNLKQDLVMEAVKVVSNFAK